MQGQHFGKRMIKNIVIRTLESSKSDKNSREHGLKYAKQCTFRSADSIRASHFPHTISPISCHNILDHSFPRMLLALHQWHEWKKSTPDILIVIKASGSGERRVVWHRPSGATRYDLVPVSRTVFCKSCAGSSILSKARSDTSIFKGLFYGSCDRFTGFVLH